RDRLFLQPDSVRRRLSTKHIASAGDSAVAGPLSSPGCRILAGRSSTSMDRKFHAASNAVCKAPLSRCGQFLQGWARCNENDPGKGVEYSQIMLSRIVWCWPNHWSRLGAIVSGSVNDVIVFLHDQMTDS